MTQDFNERTLEGYEPLTPEEAAPYVPIFGEPYWWGAPDTSPVALPPNELIATAMSKRLLQSLVSRHDGILHLGDPQQVFQKHEVVSANQLSSKSVVKVEHESLFRIPVPFPLPETPTYAGTITETGFSIIRTGRGLISRYHRDVSWWKVARAYGKRQRAFFPLFIDSAASTGNDLEDHLGAVIKVTNTRASRGIHQLPLNQTEVTKLGVSDMFARNRTLVTYIPKKQ